MKKRQTKFGYSNVAVEMYFEQMDQKVEASENRRQHLDDLENDVFEKILTSKRGKVFMKLKRFEAEHLRRAGYRVVVSNGGYLIES